MARRTAFDPYALLAALERSGLQYVAVGAFARVLRGADEMTHGIDVCPSVRKDNPRRLHSAFEDLGAQPIYGGDLRLGDAEQWENAVTPLRTPSGNVKVVPRPAGTRGYDDLRRRATREHLGRGLRPLIASTADLARMLAALGREGDEPKLKRLRLILELVS